MRGDGSGPPVLQFRKLLIFDASRQPGRGSRRQARASCLGAADMLTGGAIIQVDASGAATRRRGSAVLSCTPNYLS